MTNIEVCKCEQEAVCNRCKQCCMYGVLSRCTEQYKHMVPLARSGSIIYQKIKLIYICNVAVIVVYS